MAEVSRRGFVQAGALVTATASMLRPAAAVADPAARAQASAPAVRMTGDGPELTPSEYVALLARLVAERESEMDEYGLGGPAEEMEKRFAALLGKERALFFPTGTLANHVAIRTLAASRRRVIVQDASHVYNDTGDSAQSLSGLNLVPLAPGRATFSWPDVQKVLERTAGGRVRSDVGVVSIESPVRRLRGELFERPALEDVCAQARSRGIRLHLDGARAFVAAAYTGVTPAQYAAPFDTVYVSLWKCFGAPNGAILAGPTDVIDGLFHVRRAFGGALWAVWPFALVASHLADGFVDRLRRGIAVSEAFLQTLSGDSRLAVERVAGGSNVVALRLREGTPAAFARRVRAQGIELPAPTADGQFVLKVNETWAHETGERLGDAFRQAAKG